MAPYMVIVDEGAWCARRAVHRWRPLTTAAFLFAICTANDGRRPALGVTAHQSGDDNVHVGSREIERVRPDGFTFPLSCWPLAALTVVALSGMTESGSVSPSRAARIISSRI
jgi:hypothetical protein